jgi:hypothetical protein
MLGRSNHDGSVGGRGAGGILWGEEKCMHGLVRKPGRRSPLLRPWHRLENNITMDLTEIRWEGMDWVHLAGCCEHSD